MIRAPTLQAFSRVGKRTDLWWIAIGKNITSFAELEQSAIDWAVHFAGDSKLWKDNFGRDLKGLVPVLRRTLQKAGLKSLSEPTKKAVESSLAAIEKLTNARNYVAHLRLCFHGVPLAGTATKWVQTASHVEGRLHDGKRFVLKHRNLDWLQDSERVIRLANADLHRAMALVASELVGRER
jgi:hypothetical protein